MTLRDILRSPDGAISRSDFRRGAAFCVFLMGGAALILTLIARLTRTMDWMTVAVAPIMGGMIFFVSASLLYFWYCLFAKRLRGLGRSLFPARALLGMILFSSAARLLDYQDRTLQLELTGIWGMAGLLGTVSAVVAGLLFVGLLAIGLFGSEDPETAT